MNIKDERSAEPVFAGGAQPDSRGVMGGVGDDRFEALFRALQTAGALPEDIEGLPFEFHGDYDQLGALGVLLHQTERWPYLLTQLRKRIPPLEAYFQITQFLYSGSREYEIIERTIRRKPIGASLIRNFVDRMLTGVLPPGYAGVWLQSVCKYGLCDADIKALAWALCRTDISDQRSEKWLEGRRIVRHSSTGGLSEKTGLVLPALLVALRRYFPIVSSYMAERQRAFVGGTCNKLSVVPGFRPAAPGYEAIDILKKCGVAMVVADSKLSPAEDKLGRLVEKTGAAWSPDLIAASIASQHLAMPAHSMVLDVRYGGGGLFEKFAEARSFAGRIMQILNSHGISIVADYKAAEEPNGVCIGPALEIAESVALMSSEQPTSMFKDAALQEQRQLVIGYFDAMVRLEFGDGDWRPMASIALDDGRALSGFRELLAAHGVMKGNIDSLCTDPLGFFGLEKRATVPSRTEGRLASLDSYRLGIVARQVADANSGRGGLVIKKRLGESVTTGAPVAEIWGASSDAVETAVSSVIDAFEVSNLRR